MGIYTLVGLKFAQIFSILIPSLPIGNTGHSIDDQKRYHGKAL